jgi:hypothetical protein
MRRWFICFVVVLAGLLASCIGIESDILIRQDGSGVLNLSYTISQFIKNIDAGRSEKQLPLPVNEEDFLRSTEGIEGLRLIDLDEREDEQNVYISAEIEFDGVEAVNALGREGQIGITLETRGNTTTFRQLIYDASGGEEISEDSLEMMRTFFEGYELVYSVTVPAEVRDYTLGDLSPDGRTVTYTSTVPEILASPEPLVLEVTW